MTQRELDILISQAKQDLYLRIIRNNLTEAESDYYINSILYDLAVSQRNSAYKKLGSDEE